jgi:hypothetical protein
MAEALVRNESPVEYFRELADAAMQHQHVAASDLASSYVVDLLTGFMHFDCSADAGCDEPLGVRFVKALGAAGSRQRDELRRIGDLSLFVSGFFSDILKKSLVDVDYYIHLREHACGSLARHGALCTCSMSSRESFRPSSTCSARSASAVPLQATRIFCGCTSDGLGTKSRRSGKLLATRGIVPNASVRGFIQ